MSLGRRWTTSHQAHPKHRAGLATDRGLAADRRALEEGGSAAPELAADPARSGHAGARQCTFSSEISGLISGCPPELRARERISRRTNAPRAAKFSTEERSAAINIDRVIHSGALTEFLQPPERFSCTAR